MTDKPLTPRERVDLHDKKCELVTLEVSQSICRCRERQLTAELEEANRRAEAAEVIIKQVADNIAGAPANIIEWSAKVGNTLTKLDDITRQLARYREKYGELE